MEPPGLASVAEAAAAIAGHADDETLGDAIVDQVARVLQASDVRLVLFDADRQWLRVRYARGAAARSSERLPASHPVLAELLERGQPVLLGGHALDEAAARSWALEGEAAAQGARAMLIEPAGGGRPMLVVQVRPAPPAGRAYQVWVIRGGQPVSAGLLHRLDAPPMLMELPEALAGAEGVAISVEPASGSPRPTGPIVLGARL